MIEKITTEQRDEIEKLIIEKDALARVYRCLFKMNVCTLRDLSFKQANIFINKLKVL